MTTARRNCLGPDGAARIAAERERQKEHEGFDAEHDREHFRHELAWAAACYAAPRAIFHLQSNMEGSFEFYDPWPWDDADDRRKPDEGDAVGGTRVGVDLAVVLGTKETDVRIRELEKAGALIAAEIDRLLAVRARMEAK